MNSLASDLCLFTSLAACEVNKGIVCDIDVCWWVLVYDGIILNSEKAMRLV